MPNNTRAKCTATSRYRVVSRVPRGAPTAWETDRRIGIDLNCLGGELASTRVIPAVMRGKLIARGKSDMLTPATKWKSTKPPRGEENGRLQGIFIVFVSWEFRGFLDGFL